MIKIITLDPYSRNEWSKYSKESKVEKFVSGSSFTNPFKQQFFTPFGVREHLEGNGEYVEPLTGGLGNNARSWEGPYAIRGGPGEVGATGAKGDQGLQGLQGIAGINGLNGAAGPQGPTGDRGFQGPTGERGERGYDGPQGPAGAGGTAIGVIGPMGPTGSKGDPGNPGATGADGIRGPTGSKGDPGINGINGTNGTNGRDGTNAQNISLPLRNISATYGAGDRVNNVTGTLLNAVKWGNDLGINNWSMGGDPAHGAGKEMRVSYTPPGSLAPTVKAFSENSVFKPASLMLPP